MQTPNLVNTKKAIGRRKVRYETFDAILADAERLALVPTQILGNWTGGQIYCHLAMSAAVLFDGVPHGAPFPIQWVLRTFLKKRILSNTVSPGFQIPTISASLIPIATSTEDGLAQLRAATARLEQDANRAPRHPVFGPCNPEDWNAWHLRHCELHMSFILPQESVGFERSSPLRMA